MKFLAIMVLTNGQFPLSSFWVRRDQFHNFFSLPCNSHTPERYRKSHLGQPQHLVWESDGVLCFVSPKTDMPLVRVSPYTECWMTEMLTDIGELKKIIWFPFVIGIVISDSTKTKNRDFMVLL